MSRVRIVLCFSIIVLAHALATEKPAPRVEYLDNGTIKIGIDLSIGGSITYLADSKHLENIINSYDWGRQIQQSYYSGPVPFGEPKPHWKHLGWNPIQSGDDYRNRAKVLAHSNDGQTLYVKTVPMQWPLNNVPGECEVESWLTLEGAVARVRCRLTNRRADTTQYPARSQELPAVYTIGTLWKLMTYTGAAPFTNAPLERIKQVPPGASFPWTAFTATENWAALVSDQDWGLGVITPGVFRYLGGFAGKENTGGVRDAPCGYLAPLRDEILDHDIAYEYGYELMLGSLEEIRRYAYTRRADSRPQFVFRTDRQHWSLRNARDSGWKLGGAWRVWLEKDGAQLISPECFFASGDVPKLYLRARSNAAGAGRLYWRALEQKDFAAERSISFALPGDGQFHTVELDLSVRPEYAGHVLQLRLDPGVRGAPGHYIEIQSLSSHRPAE